MVRYESAFRRSENEIGKILVPAKDGSMIPIRELADIHTITGPLIIYRDNHARFCAVKFSVRGRDMGTAVAEAGKAPRRLYLEMDRRFREPTTGYQTLGPSRPRKYSDHLRDPIRPFRQRPGCRTGLIERALRRCRRYLGPINHEFQLLDLSGYRLYRPLRYLYTEWRDHDIGHQE